MKIIDDYHTNPKKRQSRKYIVKDECFRCHYCGDGEFYYDRFYCLKCWSELKKEGGKMTDPKDSDYRDVTDPSSWEETQDITDPSSNDDVQDVRDPTGTVGDQDN